MNKLAYLLGAREDARRVGDRGLERALTADLARLGHVDGAPEPATPRASRAAPRRRARPRCEHGKNPDRCLDCQDTETETETA